MAFRPGSRTSAEVQGFARRCEGSIAQDFADGLSVWSFAQVSGQIAQPRGCFALPTPATIDSVMIPRFANPRERRNDIAATRAVHPAPLVANFIEGDSRVLFDPAEPAPNANTGR
jgi:hypothetical protein